MISTPTVLVWGTTWTLADALFSTLDDGGYRVQVIDSDADLARQHVPGMLLVAEHGSRLVAQRAFLRGPFILIDQRGEADTNLRSRAYAVVRTVSAAMLAIDRFFEHRRLAERILGRNPAPRRCARCARVYDALKARPDSLARRFVRFGTISLCGSCVESLRTLLRRSELAVVDADR